MNKSQNIELCGWETHQCLDCPYCENDKCTFKEELIKFLRFCYNLIKMRCRGNPIEWGSVWRYYYGKKDVHEWVLSDFHPEDKNKFWELWRDGGKESFKRVGFGVIKERDIWVLFWEVKFKDVLLDLLQIEDPCKEY